MPKKETIKKERSDFLESLIETFKSNGTLFTGLAVALIILTGLTLVNTPEYWWIIAIAVLVFGAIIFLFMNARVVIKISLSIVIVVLLSAEAFRFGSLFDQHSSGGLLWMCGVWFGFFALMAYSYLSNSGASRWGALMFSTVFGYATTFVISLSELIPMNLAIILGIIVQSLIFVLIYKGSRKTRYAKDRMPINEYTERIEEKVLKAADESGWNITPIKNKKTGNSGFLIWDERAYYLHPIDMDSPFTNIGRKTLSLGYHKKTINPWLLNLVFKEAPLWKSRGANINVALLDINNKNGEPKIIGASIPDSKKKLPVGVFPASPLKNESTKKIIKVLDKIDLEMSPFTKNLTEKQKKALSRINKSDEDIDEQEENNVDTEKTEEKVEND